LFCSLFPVNCPTAHHSFSAEMLDFPRQVSSALSACFSEHVARWMGSMDGALFGGFLLQFVGHFCREEEGPPWFSWPVQERRGVAGEGETRRPGESWRFLSFTWLL
jgi:hypothetical protein